MKTTTKELDRSQVEVTVSLTAKDMEQFLDSSSQRLAQNLKVKGFREGKVPRSIVEKELGTDAIWEEALPEAVERNYWKALKENDIDPIGSPRVSVTKSIPGNDLEFKAVVPVMPEFDLPDYKSIADKIYSKERKEVKVEEDELEDALKWLQRSRSVASEGEKEEELPELNDEFAQNLGDFKDLEALKKNIKEGLEHEKKEQEKQRLRLRVLEEVRKQSDMPIAEPLVEEELNKMEAEFQEQIQGMGMTIEEYLKQVKKDLKEVREGWKEKAEERVASSIILKLIADKENVTVPEDIVQEEANKYLLQFKDAEEAANTIDPERLRSYISGIMRNEKVFELLENNKKDK